MKTAERNALDRLARTAARQRLDRRELERAIFDGRKAGLTQRQISDKLGIHSQTTVQRILRRLDEDPSLLEKKPAEVIDRYAVGEISAESMMDQLLNWTYSFGSVARINGVATDAYMSGDWDDIERAFYQGLLSDEQFARLAERQKELIGRSIRAK